MTQMLCLDWGAMSNKRSKVFIIILYNRMANKKGGKAYKKGKNDDDKPPYIDIQPGQYMARATKILGDRNVLSYCDDNVVRICHICRKMKGKVWIEVGDIVLVSLRDFSAGDPKSISRGDIIGKYPPDQVRQMSREPGVNSRLFLRLEENACVTMSNLGEDLSETQIVTHTKEDLGFEFEGSSDEEDEEEKEEVSEIEKKVDKKDKVSHGRGVRVVRADAEINIDDI